MGHDLNGPDVLGPLASIWKRAQVASEDWEDERLLKTGQFWSSSRVWKTRSPAVVLSSSGSAALPSPLVAWCTSF